MSGAPAASQADMTCRLPSTACTMVLENNEVWCSNIVHYYYWYSP